MDTIVRRAKIGARTVEVVAQHGGSVQGWATHHAMPSFVLRIDGRVRPDLTATGANPDQLLNIGITAAQIAL